jgi:hypothetical protein
MNKELIPSPNNRKAKTRPEPSRSIQNQGSLLPTIENPKSKIQNAMAGFLAIFVLLVLCGAVAQVQQPKKVARIGYLSNTDPNGSRALR